jgi:hypothetical protein
MSLSQVHYLPLAPPFFIILVGLFVIVLVLIQLGVLRYAYMRLGQPQPNTAPSLKTTAL